MTYSITKSNGTIIKELDENIIDYDTISNIGLIGKLSPNYGETQSNNFVHLAENFAGITAPDTPLTGMTYYNTDDSSLYVCTDSTQLEWKKLLTIKFEKSDNPIVGDIYYDLENHQFYIFDDTIEPLGDWVLIGPDNYNNKDKYSTVLETNSTATFNEYEIAFDTNSSNLVTAKIVGSEKVSESSQDYGVREPECAGWIFKCLVNSYVTLTGDSVRIIGSPSYEMIGRTDNNFDVELTIKDNRLNFQVSGTCDDELSTIQWEIDIEVLKV